MNPFSWWTETHGRIAPVGHALRSQYPEIWVRFHSLPDSKRYPESPDELREVVSRAATVAAELFPSETPLYVFKSRFHSEASPSTTIELIVCNEAAPGPSLLYANPGSIAPEDDDSFSSWALVERWKPEFFEELIRQVATEQEALICLAAPSSGNILCPYDGGMDVFAPDSQTQLSLRSFNGWLSSRSDGL